LTYSLRPDDGDRAVFCFAKPQGAEAFAERFGGERIEAVLGSNPIRRSPRQKKSPRAFQL
jgi:hypothetical protein